jgi:uncharacterized protein YndB with AHSA1/START domain
MNETIFEVEPCTQDVIAKHEFDAKRDLVFKTYTNPKYYPQWWGPSRLDTKVKRMDVKKGGTWQIIQRDKDGSEYIFDGVFHRIEAPNEIVYTMEYEGMPGHVSLDVVDFTEHDGKTLVTERTIFESVEDRENMLKTGMEEGIRESYDRFEKLLDKIH